MALTRSKQNGASPSARPLTLMTKTLTIAFIFFTFLLFGQKVSSSKIEQYIIKTDSLLKLNSFVRKDYDGMSFCGGTLTGFYKNDQLVLVKSWYSYEAGYSTLDAYYLNNILVAIKRDEHYAEWEKYSEDYPNGEGENGDTYKNMSFTDTTYKVILIDEPMMYKFSEEANIDYYSNEEQLNKWLICIKSMLLELAEKRDEAILFYTTEMKKLKN